MKELTCIICPNGCNLVIDDNKNVTGNNCKRGIDFAIQELTNPVRTISSTVRTTFPNIPVVSVKLDKEVSKDKIFKCMEEINKVVIDKPLGINDVVIKNVANTDSNVILTTNILKEDL